MSDLIERQDALDALKGKLNASVKDTEAVVEYLNGVIERILQLPSAQPEIIHCRDCEYGEIDQDNWWYCTNLGCQIGEPDGSGFCADAEKRR